MGSTIESDEQLYTEKHLQDSLNRIEAVDYHSTIEVAGIRFTPYHAGHVLGAAMYSIEIANLKVLFTGDYSREEDRHLIAAEVPPERPDVLITESTYGTGSHQPREEREARLLRLVHSTIIKGGRVLMPVFSLGNVQELMLILDEYWENHPELHSVPIYYTSSISRKCMAVYQTYVNTMNENIRTAFQRRNPFIFKFVSSLRNLDKFDDIGPCVMLAAPGMLQTGISRELLERWAPEPKNCLIVTGYSVDGTMAKNVMNQPQEIESLSGPKIPLRMKVEEISFAAHVDFGQNMEFIDKVDASHIVLVHGEQSNMGRLKSALLSKYSDKKDEKKIWNPKNCEEIKLEIKGNKIAQVIGALAATKAAEGSKLSGVLVQQDFQLSLVSPEDLEDIDGLVTNHISMRQRMRLHAGMDLVRYHLEEMFGYVASKKGKDGFRRLIVMDSVNVIFEKDSIVVIEWEANALSDTLADTVLAILLCVESSPISLKLTSGKDGADIIKTRHARITEKERVEHLKMFLSEQFGKDSLKEEENGVIKISVDPFTVTVDPITGSVESTSRPLRERTNAIVSRAFVTIAPFASVKEEEEEEDDDEDMEDEIKDKKEKTGDETKEETQEKVEKPVENGVHSIKKETDDVKIMETMKPHPIVPESIQKENAATKDNEESTVEPTEKPTVEPVEDFAPIPMAQDPRKARARKK